MPIDASSATVVTGFDNVPRMAQGMVRDLRIRWALEEIERPYRPQLIDAFAPRPEGYCDWQPFGQVPAFADGDMRLFESGAILLYLGEQDERLLPRQPHARWTATSWLIAALNSVEPMLMQIVILDMFQAGQVWTEAARPSAVELARARLKSTADALGDKDWLAGSFSIADIMMVTVLRNIDHTDILAGFPGLAAYKARGESRPAFQRALADQISGYVETAE